MKTGREKNSRIKGLFLVLVIFLCLLPTFCFMNMDTYRTGDEIVTYGMANEPDQGWMFSKGRIRTYLEMEILGDGILKVPGNIFHAAIDVLENRKNALFFRMDRPEENGWYTGEQMRGYLQITSGEAFRPADIYLNAMGDDANSFLYYLCLHFLSSLLPAVSASKWSGFLLNLFCMVLTLYFLYRISSFVLQKESAKYLVLIVYACSSAAVSTYTYIRPYALTIAVHEWLFLLHLEMLDRLEKDGAAGAQKYFKWMISVYVVGYVSHYTTGIWAVCLAMYTCCRAYKEKKFICSYLVTGIFAVLLGICVDPMSVPGLLFKKNGDGNGSLLTAYSSMFSKWVHGLFGSYVWLIVPGIIICIAIGRYVANKNERPDSQKVLFCILPVVYLLISTFLMRVDKLGTVFPYFFVIIAMLICFVLGRKQIWKRIVLAVCLLLWGAGMFGSLVEEKNSEGEDYRLLKAMMTESDQDSVVFIRNHGAGYDKIPLLGSFEKVFLWTADEGCEAPDGFMQAVEDSGIVLMDGNPEQLESMASDVWSACGYSADCLMETEQFALLYVYQMSD